MHVLLYCIISVIFGAVMARQAYLVLISFGNLIFALVQDFYGFTVPTYNILIPEASNARIGLWAPVALLLISLLE